MIPGLEEVAHKQVNATNFLGNSLLASVLNDSEKQDLFERVQFHKYCESRRRDYFMDMREGLISFFMDSNNLRDAVVIGYLAKLAERPSTRVLVNGFCDNEAVEQVQVPQLRTGYKDHRYYMGLDRHEEVGEREAKIDFEDHYLLDWAGLFRVIYDVSVCPKGFNCSRAEGRIKQLLDKIGYVSEEDWMREVHGTSYV